MYQLLLILSLLLFSSLSAQAQDTLPLNNVAEAEIVVPAEELARFPGCETLDGDTEAKQRCAYHKLLRFIYGNMRYPVMAREKGTHGQVLVSFIVTTDGRIKDIELLKGPGDGLGQEAKRVVQLMNRMREPWIPGRLEGVPVETRYKLPVNFRITEHKSTKKSTKED